MRIGIASLGRVSEDTGGKNYMVHFLAELGRMDHGHDVVLFLSEGESEALGLSGATEPPPSPLLSRSARRRGSSVIEIPNSKRTPLHKVIGEQWKLAKAIRAANIDVMYYPGNFISLRSRVPSVVAIRATANFYGAKYGINGVRRLVRSLLMPPSARRAKAIITPSEDIKRDVIRFTHAEPSKIHVIPHGVDIVLFDGDANRAAPDGFALLERAALRPQNYLLYVSALWRYKNQDKLIRAHAKLVHDGYPNLKLVIAGKGTGTEKSYQDELLALPKQLGTEGLVVFTGALPQSDLRYLYAHAKAFVFPSSYESFGNPIFEAWASGVPIATANVHSFPEIVGDAGLMFDPLNVDEMTGSIQRLLNDDALRAELIATGRERAKHYTWERAVRETRRVIESVGKTSKLE